MTQQLISPVAKTFFATMLCGSGAAVASPTSTNVPFGYAICAPATTTTARCREARRGSNDRTIPGFWIGAGSVLALEDVIYTSELPVVASSGVSAENVHTVNEQIASIRSAFSLQITELARVMHVQRPTIYTWLNGDAILHQENRARLNEIHSLAQAWNARSQRPLAKVCREAANSSGSSLIDMLSKDVIGRNEVLSLLDALAIKQASDLTHRKPTLRQLAAQRGVTLASYKPGESELDQIMGDDSVGGNRI